MGYPKNRLAVLGLIEWIQDLNWPGAEIVLETLESIDLSILLPNIEIALQKAIYENDKLWISSIKELIINRLNIKISDFQNEDLYKTLLSIDE